MTSINIQRMHRADSTGFRGIVFNSDNCVVDVAENADASVVLDYLFSQHDITAVKLSDGTLDSGDELSVREVADIAVLSL